jgi:small subunit ribosomal protein S5
MREKMEKMKIRKVRSEEEENVDRIADNEKIVEHWVPKTAVGKKVKDGDIKSLEELFDKNYVMMEPEIFDALVAKPLEKLVDFKKTTRVTRQGRNFSFRATVLVGDGEQFIGVGIGKDKERFPAIRKAARNAKLDLVRVRKGAGSWESTAATGASLPFRVAGKSASVRVELLPAPEGTGLVVGEAIKDVMRFAGVKNVWSKTSGNTRSKLDFVKAAVGALSNTTKMRISKDIETKFRRV